MRLPILLALLTGVLSAAAPTQEKTFSGAWSLSAEAASGQNEDGSNWTKAAFKGTLDCEQNGANVTGTWKGPKASWPFTGTAEGDTFEVRTEARPMPATTDGQPTTVMARWTFRGRVAGDKIRGTLTLTSVNDDDTARLQPFTAEHRR